MRSKGACTLAEAPAAGGAEDAGRQSTLPGYLRVHLGDTSAVSSPSRGRVLSLSGPHTRTERTPGVAAAAAPPIPPPRAAWTRLRERRERWGERDSRSGEHAESSGSLPLSRSSASSSSS